MLGVVALNQIKQTREGGHGLAIAGIAVGAVTLLLNMIWTISPSVADMTTSDPEQPCSPPAAPSIRRWRIRDAQPDPNPPVDYPTDAGLPPPSIRRRIPVRRRTRAIRARPATTPGGYDPYRPTKPPGTNGKAIAALVTSLVGPDVLRPAVDRRD